MTTDEKQIGTVTVELAYEDALRLWVLVHDPEHAGTRRDTDPRIQKIVNDAINVAEGDYTSSPTGEAQNGD